MPNNQHQFARFVITDSDGSRPPSCWPVDFDETGLIDITAIGDKWVRLVDPQSGKVHDGAEYHKQMLETL